MSQQKKQSQKKGAHPEVEPGDGPAHDGPAYDGPAHDGPAHDGHSSSEKGGGKKKKGTPSPTRANQATQVPSIDVSTLPRPIEPGSPEATWDALTSPTESRPSPTPRGDGAIPRPAPGGAGGLPLTLVGVLVKLRALVSAYGRAYERFLGVADVVAALPEEPRGEGEEKLGFALVDNAFLRRKSKSSRLVNFTEAFETHQDAVRADLRTVTGLPDPSSLVDVLSPDLGFDAVKAEALSLKSEWLVPSRDALVSSQSDLVLLINDAGGLLTTSADTDPQGYVTLISVKASLFSLKGRLEDHTAALEGAIEAIDDALSSSAGVLTQRALLEAAHNEGVETLIAAWAGAKQAQDDLLSEVASAVEGLVDVHDWLEARLDEFTQDLRGVLEWIRTVMRSAYDFLAFQILQVTCNIKQDPWTQSGHDRIYYAYIAIEPDGRVYNRYVSLGDFEEGQSKSYTSDPILIHRFGLPEPIPALSEATLESLATDAEAVVAALRESASQFYLVFLALWERDGSDDIDKKWGDIVESVSAIVARETDDSGTGNLSSQLEDIKSQILEEIVNSLVKWNEDELLQALAYHKWQVFPSQTFHPEDDPDGSSSGYSVTATTWTESKVYSNASRVGNSREGKYTVKTQWEYQNG